MAAEAKALPIHIPLTGLLDLAFDAMLAEFMRATEESEFHDLRITHGCVFRYVKDPGLRLTEIAELANMTKQSAGEVVDDLVERGYVERVPDPADRRAKLIRLTARGREAQAFGFRTFAEIEERWGERYGVEQVGQLRSVLEEIVASEAPYAVPRLPVPQPAGG